MTTIPMVIEPVAEWTSLLAPLPGEDPGGLALRYEGTYDALREARRSDDASLPRGDWVRPLKKADWAAVAGIAADALRTRTKDAHIAAWLLEAWLVQRGFPGAMTGLQLLSGLCEQYWVVLHPRPDVGDDEEVRLSPFVWLDEKMPAVLKQVLITAPTDSELDAFGWNDVERTQRQAPPASKAKEKAPKEGQKVITRELVLASIASTPPDFLRQRVHEVRATIHECARLETVLEAKAGANAPTLRQFRAALEPIDRWLVTQLTERGEPLTVPVPVVMATEVAAVPMASADELRSMDAAPVPAPSATSRAPDLSAVPSGPLDLQSRDDAYRRLEEVAQFLMRTEPHSPTPYLIRRAVGWGRLSLADLMVEFMTNGYDLPALSALLGIADANPPPAPPPTSRRG